MRLLVLKTETVTSGVYVEAPDIVEALKKVRAMKKPRWFIAERNTGQWSVEGVCKPRKP